MAASEPVPDPGGADVREVRDQRQAASSLSKRAGAKVR
jgi:hypothetical protein